MYRNGTVTIGEIFENYKYRGSRNAANAKAILALDEIKKFRTTGDALETLRDLLLEACSHVARFSAFKAEYDKQHPALDVDSVMMGSVTMGCYIEIALANKTLQECCYCRARATSS